MSRLQQERRAYRREGFGGWPCFYSEEFIFGGNGRYLKWLNGHRTHCQDEVAPNVNSDRKLCALELNSHKQTSSRTSALYQEEMKLGRGQLLLPT